MDPVILIGVFLVVLIVVGMAAAIIVGNERDKKKRALAVIKGVRSAPEGNSEKDARGEQNRRRAEIAKKLKEESEKDEDKKKKETMSARLEMSGLKISVQQYWIFSAIACAVATIAAIVFSGKIFIIIPAAIVGLLGIPHFVVSRGIKKRQKKFLEEFADALEAMVRLLKAGMPVTEAISMAGREFGGPVGEEMTRIYEAQKVGITLPEATRSSAKRVPLPEMNMFATGIAIQAQTGASLSDVLMNLAGTIRARYRLKRKVQALSSEAKASAGIIGCLPFLVGGGLFAINPDYMNIMFETFAGRALLVGGGVWMMIGIFIMKAMINFKV